MRYARTLVLICAFFLITLVLGFSFLAHLVGEQLAPQRVYIAKSFPYYKEFSTFFAAQRGVRLTTDMASANIYIDTTIPKGFSTISPVLVYELTPVLVDNFKDQGIVLSTAEARQILIENKSVSIDSALSTYFPSLPITTDAISYLGQNQNNYALIPFSSLTNEVHVVPVDNSSPIEKTFSPSQYPFSLLYYIAYQSPLTKAEQTFISSHIHIDRDASKIHSIIMTGTTAMGRGVYFRMKTNGWQYPALDIAPTLKDADITHVSNEVSIASDCTQQVGTLTFCALPSSIDTLKYSGVNLVELTGNHNNDWGTQADLDTLQAYDANHIAHFGGGVNATAARQPAILTVGDMKVGFLGYNEPGPAPAWATDSTPGAAKLSDDALITDIKALRPDVDVLFVDIQFENENDLQASASQIHYAQEAIDNGADIVTGSQAHRPQGMMFYKGKTVVFGMGNLFFDQMEVPEKRMGYITKYFFYDKHLISTTLTPTLLFDYSQPHIATGGDAQNIWDMIWQGSINLP